jgi:hypothetical protein
MVALTRELHCIRRAILSAALFASLAPLSAQWQSYPAAGIPRTKDGKADLSAPTPKDPGGKPDLSGLWLKDRSPWQPPANEAGLSNSMAYYMPPGSEIVMKPAAAALYKQRYEVQQGAGRPSERCLPHSIPDQMFIPVPLQFVQTKGLTVMLWEEFTHYRMIYTDGRPRPVDPNPAWYGYSTGTWDGDTFVVDTRGFNDKSWLDDGGHPHTGQLHTVEKFRRPDFGHLKTEITIDDPGAYSKPMTLYVNFSYLADQSLIEDICENEKDARHQVGKR